MGTSRLRLPLVSADTIAFRRALTSLGVQIRTREDDEVWEVTGVGRGPAGRPASGARTQAPRLVSCRPLPPWARPVRLRRQRPAQSPAPGPVGRHPVSSGRHGDDGDCGQRVAHDGGERGARRRSGHRRVLTEQPVPVRAADGGPVDARPAGSHRRQLGQPPVHRHDAGPDAQVRRGGHRTARGRHRSSARRLRRPRPHRRTGCLHRLLRLRGRRGHRRHRHRARPGPRQPPGRPALRRRAAATGGTGGRHGLGHPRHRRGPVAGRFPRRHGRDLRHLHDTGGHRTARRRAHHHPWHCPCPAQGIGPHRRRRAESARPWRGHRRGPRLDHRPPRRAHRRPHRLPSRSPHRHGLLRPRTPRSRCHARRPSCVGKTFPGFHEELRRLFPSTSRPASPQRQGSR